MIDVLCLGHTAYDISFILDEFPREDLKYSVSRGFSESGGGPAANAACLLARWGLRAGYAGLAGNDIYGGQIVKGLEEAGVNLALLQRPEGFDTPLSGIIINRSTGSRTLINRRDDKAPVPVPPASRWDNLEPQILLADGHYHELALEALGRFPKAPLILDGGSWREGTRVLAERADFLIVSEAFARDAAGVADLESPENRHRALDFLFQLGGASTVVTLGARGLIHKTEEGEGSLEAFPAQAVDTTGAGDVFHGAFAYCLYWGMEWEESLIFSSLAASFSVERPGGRPSIPELHRVVTAFEKLTGGPERETE